MSTSVVQMPQEEVEALAFDVACEFYDDTQLCIRYELTLSQLQNIKTQTAFLREVNETKKVLEGDDKEFVFKAKQYSLDALEELHDIVQDRKTSKSIKIKAAKEIFEAARMQRGGKPPSAGDGPLVGRLVIQTNLTTPTSANAPYVATVRGDVASHPDQEAAEAEFIEVTEDRKKQINKKVARLPHHMDLIG